MNDILFIGLVLIAGLLLGILFFGGLWFTVGKTAKSKIPALWMIGSFLIRTSITLYGFYYISLGDWRRLLAALSGFVIARYIIFYFTSKEEEKQKQIRKEMAHEAKP